jgi:hypothetical protein
MIGTELQSQLNAFGEQLWNQAPLFAGARQGSVSPAIIQRYLANVLYLIRHTPIYLQLAYEQAQRRGFGDFAAFYKTKLAEEDGHDQWAETDLQSLGKNPDELGDVIAPSMRKLVTVLKDSILDDPTIYVGYIFFAEYLTVEVGPRWLEALSLHCGIPESSMSVVGNHIELDKEHIVEGLKAIDSLVDEARKTPLLLALQTYMVLFERLCEEIYHGDLH